VSTSASLERPTWTIGALLDWTAAYLHQKASESPRLDAEVLLAHVLGCRRIELYTRHGELAPEEVRARYRDIVRQRVEGCPVAYLVGFKEFFSLTFDVNRNVLIPRPDSEHVVLACLHRAKALCAPRILDLGVGSGNLSVALARQVPKAHVVAIDRSPEALEVAAANAKRHGVAERIKFRAGDLFGALTTGEMFDFIVSNPPYIPTSALDALPVGVRDYEPRMALDGGPDGFAVFDRILAGAADFLTPGGWLIVEIGAPQHDEARRRFVAHSCYQLADTIYDGSRHPRVLCARRV
jgi:release factor glutamine methyltransferase